MPEKKSQPPPRRTVEEDRNEENQRELAVLRERFTSLQAANDSYRQEVRKVRKEERDWCDLRLKTALDRAEKREKQLVAFVKWLIVALLVAGGVDGLALLK